MHELRKVFVFLAKSIHFDTHFSHNSLVEIAAESPQQRKYKFLI